MKSAFSINHSIYITMLCLLLSIVSFSTYAGSKTERQCLLSIDLLNKLNKTNNFLFVDVRNKNSFNKNNIPGSINIPLHLLATKSFLKTQHVVLVGNGWDEPALTETCKLLNNKNFKSVQVLTGGVISWFKKKAEINKRELISLTAKEFFNNKIEKKFVPVVIMNKRVSDSKKKQITTLLPHAKIISGNSKKKQILNRINGLGKGQNNIVIFSDTTTSVDKAINEYFNHPLRKIYFFEGGFDAYQDVINLNKMTAIGKKNKRLSTKKPVSCAN